MLSGLLSPTRGQIIFGDKDVTSLEPQKRGIGLVFQNYALYPHMTVLQNILFPLENIGMPKEDRMKRAEEVAKIVQIENLLDRKPSELSGGQQQRVAIARALAKQPDVLLLMNLYLTWMLVFVYKQEKKLEEFNKLLELQLYLLLTTKKKQCLFLIYL